MHGEGEAARRSRSCSPSCTPAASSATAAATRSRAACTASACRSSTRSPSSLHVEIRRDGHVWTQDYERGAPQGRAEEGRRRPKETGTTITFLPDADIFESLDFEFDVLEQRLRETAFLTRGLRITFVDERGEGRRAGVQVRRRHPATSSPTSTRTRSRSSKKIVYFEGESDEGAVEVAMQWNSSYQESIFSFANNINTHEGGTHLSRLPLRAHAHAEQVRARQGAAQGEGREPRRRGRARGPDRRHLGQAARPAVRGPDEDQARQPRHAGLRRVDRQREARRVPRGEPAARRNRVIRKAVAGRPGARGRAQGPRPHAAQVGARELAAARQAGRLLGQGPGAGGALHRRGRLGRRLGQAGPRPQHPGRPAAARQDPQRREEPDRQGPPERRDPGADHGHRHRRARRVRPRRGPATTRSSSRPTPTSTARTSARCC